MQTVEENKILKDDEYVFKCLKCGHTFKGQFAFTNKCPDCGYSGLSPQGKFIINK